MRLNQKRTVPTGLLLVTVFYWSFTSAMQTGPRRYPMKFSKSCPDEDYRFDPKTGTFLCVVPTAKLCFELCQSIGCNEWFFANMISTRNETVLPYHRCRCVPQLRMCLYNPVPRAYRDFE
ncbi:hypothetical protein CSKR_106960 [Clonorchis sinensis]|uniref:Uncharacterized protein n=2 Tax=Clonorchis sinensis TaxID=79923 RepID=A0A8T1LZT3_CLOSI|nr:hypothetical protein CSKR_106960 [Clonorchis sinensis]GAA54113.1 hypothetical protein CLF_112195 [Clonorchis sinensis]